MQQDVNIPQCVFCLGKHVLDKVPKQIMCITGIADLPLIWGELDGVDVGMIGLWNVSISKKSSVPSSLAATTL